MENNENLNVTELNEESLEEVSGGKSAGQKVKATGDVYYDYRGVAWYKVSFHGRKGWVSSKYSKIV